MAEIFWNPAVENFFVRLYARTSENLAWQEEELREDFAAFETVARIVSMLKHSGNEWAGVYRALQEAVQAPYERNITDLFDELEGIWEHDKAGTFLAVAVDMVETILYFRELASARSEKRQAIMNPASVSQPEKILA